MNRFYIFIIQIVTKCDLIIPVINGNPVILNEMVVFFFDLRMPVFGKFIFFKVINGRNQSRIPQFFKVKILVLS